MKKIRLIVLPKEGKRYEIANVDEKPKPVYENNEFVYYVDSVKHTLKEFSIITVDLTGKED